MATEEQATGTSPGFENRRIPSYLSPTGISKYRHDPEQYYVMYLSKNSPAREPQTQAMAIGSAFDAYAKSFLHEKLFGRGNDPKYTFEALFEAQVQEQWRDWANFHGLYVFNKYKSSGALGDLLTDLQQAVNVPKFEIDVTGVISNQREPVERGMSGVMFLGKPDVFFMNKFAAHVIIDFKVNGYVSAYPKSPMPGFVRIRGDNVGRNAGGAHPDAVLQMHHGVMINAKASLHQFNVDWATQLSIYAWLCGVEVGDDFIAGIDQICCAPTGTEFPDLRFAEHRMRIAPDFQREVITLAQKIWRLGQSEHYFEDMDLASSKARCQLLDQQAADIANMDPVFLEMTRSAPSFPKKGV